ncbi:NAD-dependent deacetylase sirtuin-7 [Myotis davidii]|uniref:Regulatory protein SIR2 homolog 7 n=1 Tax=Myotis davidii TaxID=225400 RepID=L5MKP4_MYODS|nr:NAD-dependent deacetylase sirtuin-7 [Myotis davidii]
MVSSCLEHGSKETPRAWLLLLALPFVPVGRHGCSVRQLRGVLAPGGAAAAASVLSAQPAAPGPVVQPVWSRRPPAPSLQAASIPDYRGPNGVWTLLQKGRRVSAADLSEAEPTLTHMSIARLHEQKLVCTACTPNKEYVRVFDVTERTALHRHQTGRACHKCGAALRDTIVHFGERGTLGQPLNWEAATQAASKADTILCLGSSLKVLKKYPCLWCMTKPPSRRPKLYIVNLQWTPKDDWAALKLHGKCDDVMQLLMDELGLEIPPYSRWQDPIFSLATPLRAGEEGSHSRKSLRRSREEPSPGDQGAPLSSAPILGGWFGRGCAKGTKRKRVT